MSQSRLFCSRNNPRKYSRQVLRDQVVLQHQAEEVPDATKESPKKKVSICGCFKISAVSSKAFSQMMDVSLLRDPIFIMFAVSNFLTSVGFNVPYVYTVVSNWESLMWFQVSKITRTSSSGSSQVDGHV